MRTVLAFVAPLLMLLAIPAQESSATPHCQRCPYDCGDLGLGHKDCSELSRSGGLCCVDLTQKGLELARELERARNDAYGNQGGGYQGRGQDRCPAGFQPSERKCSPDERRRGCKDIRTPSGLGCVNR